MCENDRRQARFLVTPEFVALLGVGKYEVVENPLPADAKVVAAFYDGQHSCFSVTLESEEFDPLEKGMLVPIVRSPQIRKIEDDVPV